MNTSPPIPWRDVPVGAVALPQGVPRTVLANEEANTADTEQRFVLLEGIAPQVLDAGATVHLVLLDEVDAVTNLLAAGLTIEPIGE